MLFCVYSKHERKNVEEERFLTEKKELEIVFNSMLQRQLDLKYYMQLAQDVELIKKVVFQERHLVLAPLVALEAEKRVVKKRENILQDKKETLLGRVKEMDTALRKSSKIHPKDSSVQPIPIPIPKPYGGRPSLPDRALSPFHNATPFGNNRRTSQTGSPRKSSIRKLYRQQSNNFKLWGDEITEHVAENNISVGHSYQSLSNKQINAPVPGIMMEKKASAFADFCKPKDRSSTKADGLRESVVELLEIEKKQETNCLGISKKKSTNKLSFVTANNVRDNDDHSIDENTAAEVQKLSSELKRETRRN